MAEANPAAPQTQQSGAPLPISASPLAFGANTFGQGLEDVGKAETGASDMLQQHAQVFQAVNNKTEGDALNQGYYNEVNQYKEQWKVNNNGADPNNPAMPAGFSKLNDGLAGAEEIRKAWVAKASNPMVAAQLESDSRRVGSSIAGQLADFAFTRRKDWIISTNKGNQATVLNQMVNDKSLFDDTSDGAPRSKYLQSQAAIDDQLGVSQAEGAANIQKTLGKAGQFIAETAAEQGDVPGAMAFLEAHKPGTPNAMDAESYHLAMAHIAPKVLMNDAMTIGYTTAHEFLDKATQGATAAVAGGQAYSPPVEGARISSKFGERPAPMEGASTDHMGVDFAAPAGSAVHAVAPGEVISAGPMAGYGNAIQIKHPDGSISLYGHLNSVGVKVGDQVDTSSNIGQVGSTGISTGPHLHLGIKNAQGQWIDPSSVLGAHQAVTGRGNLTSDTIKAMGEQVYNTAYTRFLANHNNDQVGAEQAGRAAMTQLSLAESTATGRETQAFSAVMGTAVDMSIKDLPTLIARTPGGQTAWDNLSGSQQIAARQRVNENATGFTVDRESAMQQAEVLGALARGGDSSATQRFLALDPNSGAYTAGYGTKLATRQAELKAGQAQQSESDKTFNRAARSPEITAYINNNKNWNGQASKTQQDMLLAALHGAVDTFTLEQKRPPNDQELSTRIYPKIWAAYAQKVGQQGSDSWNAALSGLQARGNTYPQPTDVQREIFATRLQAQDYFIHTGQPQRARNEKDIQDWINANYKHEYSMMHPGSN
jgi:murein DD-endopeptidase MepM/ murein hydrolase activator NlpD